MGARYQVLRNFSKGWKENFCEKWHSYPSVEVERFSIVGELQDNIITCQSDCDNCDKDDGVVLINCDGVEMSEMVCGSEWDVKREERGLKKSKQLDWQRGTKKLPNFS